ncbi:hypothetical protein [Streptomyces sp. NPDC051776]|uniref:hypothetical protein n=1 Tax=Streptomyces sp. NPDC051776 TaxID=3155414 RepID=UPI003449E1D3
MFEMVEQELMRNRTEELLRQAEDYRRARQARGGTRRRRAAGKKPESGEPQPEGRVDRTLRKIARRRLRTTRTC